MLCIYLPSGTHRAALPSTPHTLCNVELHGSFVPSSVLGRLVHSDRKKKEEEEEEGGGVLWFKSASGLVWLDL